MPWSTTQQFHLSLWPHFTGPLSMLGSSLIIYEVLSDRSKRRKVFHRLLLAMSICDWNTSFWYFLSTWPIPEGTTKNVFGASGTMATCTAQGFFVQFGIATPLYNACLAFYYLLIVRYKWKEKRLVRAEKYFHALPLLWAAGTSFAALGMKMLNNANLWCWIASVPLSCSGSHRNGGVNDCERGNNAWIFRWAFFYAPLWAAIFVSMIAMFLTYDVVRTTERQTDKWRDRANMGVSPDAQRRISNDYERRRNSNDSLGVGGNGNSTGAAERRKHSRQVAHQAFFYLLAFYASWTPATLTRLIQMVWGRTYYPIILLMAIFTPMQGFLNYLVYSRPRWNRYRRRHPEWGFFAALFMVAAVKCIPYYRKDNDERKAMEEGATSQKGGGNFSRLKTTFGQKSSLRSSFEGRRPSSSGQRYASQDSFHDDNGLGGGGGEAEVAAANRNGSGESDVDSHAEDSARGLEMVVERAMEEDEAEEAKEWAEANGVPASELKDETTSLPQ